MFEAITPENFDAKRYLLANKDLLLALGSNHVAAAQHLHEHGLREKRRQLTAEFLASPEFEDYCRAPPQVIEVFEAITPENFDPRRYLLANPDLHAVFGDDEQRAADHLRDYGLKENRRQVSDVFLSSRGEKFARFKHTLPDNDADAFPVSFAAAIHQLSEYDGESSNGMLGFWVTELVGNPDKLYADIGAGMRPTVLSNCVCVEVYPSVSADILIDPDCRLPFKDASLDGIGCFAVLEHVNRPWVMAAEFARVVKPGGKIFVDWPFLQPVHGYPSHYYNATREGLRQLFAEQFEIDELYTGGWQGPDYTVNWILNALIASINDDAARQRLLNLTVADLCNEPPRSGMWQKLLGAIDDRAMSMLSCGNLLIARRK